MQLNQMFSEQNVKEEPLKKNKKIIMAEWLENLQYLVSRNVMKSGQRYANGVDKVSVDTNEEPDEAIAQATYLLPRRLQRKKFLQCGYIDGTPGDYGLVRKAVGKNNYPVFQTAPDKISRNQLTPIGNHISIKTKLPKGTQLRHAGSYPSAFYVDQDFKVYRKDWDLNDYGNTSGCAGTQYGYKQFLADLIDKIGSPTVVTTGFQPVLNYKGEQYTLYDLYDKGDPTAINFIKDKGLVPYYEEVPVSLGPASYKWNGERWKNGKFKKLTMFTLPEVTVTAKRKKNK